MPGRILFVDDEERILAALREYFIDCNYEVDCALTVEAARDFLARAQYSVVVTDISFTGINGIEGLDLVEYVRQFCPGTRVLVLTAHFSEETEDAAMGRGADAYLTKPISLSYVEKIVAGLHRTEGQ